jgi:hypothetical protein
MPVSDREVFAYFRADPKLQRESARLSYASYAEAKYDWVEHFEQRHGREPSPGETDEWIANLPESRLTEIRDSAQAVFEDAAREFMEEQIEVAKAEAIDGSILREVRRLNQELSAKVARATSPRAALPVGIAGGVIASLVFTILVMVAAAIYERDPSPFAVIKSLESRPAALPSGG